MSTLSNLRELIKSAKADKAANTKSAFGGSDSTHPTDKEDDGNVDPKEGPRGAEHAKDLKPVPGPNNVNDAPEAKPDEQNGLQMNVGLTSKTVGSDSANEKPDRMKPEDPGTTHPANAEKMAAADLHKSFESSANGLLAKIAAGRQPAQQAATTPEHKAAAAGYADAASVVDAGKADDPDLAKFASALVRDYILAANLTVAHLKKVAADEDGDGKEDEGGEKSAPKKEESDEGGEGGEGGGGAPPEMSGAPGDLVSQMQGGGGGAPGGAPGGDPMADAQELLSVLAEMGMSPRDLIDALKSSMGGGGGMGGPPGAGAAPPPPPDMGGGMGGGGMPPDGMTASGPAGAEDPTAKLARYNGLIRLAEFTQKMAAAGALTVVTANTPEKAKLRGETKSALKNMINPRLRR